MTSVADRSPSLFAGVEPLEVFVELLSEIDVQTSSTEFYDRICEAICRLTTMRRAAIFMADADRGRVRAVGAHGIASSRLAALRPTLVNTPIAQRALLEDRVVVISERIEEEVPPEYAEVPPETATTLAAELERIRRSSGMVVEVDWRGDFSVPPDLEPLAQSVLAEALRNVSKHAQPARVEVLVARDADTFTLEVRNDGA